MSNSPSTKPVRLSPALIGVGVLVMALGFGLPMLTSGSTPEKPGAAAELRQTAAGTPVPMAPPSTTGIGASLLRLAAGLAVVCGICIALARWFGQKTPATPGAMEVLASITVARCVIHLVRSGDRRLLIGTDLSGVKAILELPGPLPEPEVPPEPPAERVPAPLPGEVVSEVATPAASAEPPPTPEQLQLLLDRLRNRS